MNDDFELARWRGMIDERTARSVDRLNEINGDVREIRMSLATIEMSIRTSEASAKAVEVILRDRESHGLTRWQKAVGLVGVLCALVATVLPLAGVHG